jgi:hypothetical protein
MKPSINILDDIQELKDMLPVNMNKAINLAAGLFWRHLLIWSESFSLIILFILSDRAYWKSQKEYCKLLLYKIYI